MSKEEIGLYQRWIDRLLLAIANAEQKRLRRAQRNLKLKASGGLR